jgi:hypothetical protein
MPETGHLPEIRAPPQEPGNAVPMRRIRPGSVPHLARIDARIGGREPALPVRG